MVIDHLKNASCYYGLNARFKRAFDFLREKDFSKMDPGKYEIDGLDIYALVATYETKPKNKGTWEAHQRYIDIQYLAEGMEMVGYAPIEEMVSRDYQEAEDYLTLEGEGDFIILRQGNFAIFQPQDAHMPGLAANSPQAVKKIIVKVRLD